MAVEAIPNPQVRVVSVADADDVCDSCSWRRLSVNGYSLDLRRAGAERWITKQIRRPKRGNRSRDFSRRIISGKVADYGGVLIVSVA